MCRTGDGNVVIGAPVSSVDPYRPAQGRLLQTFSDQSYYLSQLIMLKAIELTITAADVVRHDARLDYCLCRGERRPVGMSAH